MIFQVRYASFRPGERGNPFYLMRLGDSTGQIDAIWMNAENIDLKVGDFVSVDGKAQNYQGRLQIKITSCHVVPPESIDQQLYSAVFVDEKELKQKLLEHINSIEIESLYNVVKQLILEEHYELFSKAPAATFNHHSYVGGLMEHSVNVASICQSYIPLYKDVKKDILIAGALLHDIGKMYELEFLESISYTTKGNLLGHIFMGAHLFMQATEKYPKFPKYLQNQVAHIILSHHGLIERGSPVEPRTLEAILVHKADTTDADANACMISMSEGAGDNWLQSRTLNRILYVEPLPDFKKKD